MSGAGPLQVRYFAAAKAAMGAGEERIGPLPDLATLITDATRRVPAAAGVLARCSFLVDGVATTDPDTPLRPGARVDVLPPFAGG